MRPFPRIKFIWGAGRVIRGRWYLGLFGFYDRVEGEPDSGLAISVRGGLAWGAAFALLLYVAGATALHRIWERNPYNRLTYADALLYPLRRTEIAEKKGQAFLAQGQDFFLQKKYQDAANLLRLGLARYPQDREGRITLAQFYQLANQREQALRVLDEGLGIGGYPGRPYVQFYLGAAAEAEDFERVAETTRKLLADPRPELEPERRWLRERRFAALTALGRHAEALAVAEAGGEGDLATEQRVLALLALDRKDEALQLTARWRARPEADVAAALRLRVRVLREAGRHDEMDTALGELRALRPADPGPLVFAVVQRAMVGRAEAAAAALEDFLFRFGGDVANLVLVAEPLAEIRAKALLDRCAEAARERGYPPARFQSLQLQVTVLRGDWEAAARELAALAPPAANEPLIAQAWREWMRRLIEAGRSGADTQVLALTDFLRSRGWPTLLYRQSVEALRAGGRGAAAREVLALSVRAFPASEWFRRQSAEVQAELAKRNPPAETAAMSDRPAGETFEEEDYWRRLDNLIRVRAWPEALALAQAARSARPVPPWLATRDHELRLRQVRSAFGAGDRTAAVSHVRFYLNGDPGRAEQVLAIAREAADAGDRDGAVLLAREVVRRNPDFEEAKTLLAVWRPAEPKAARDP